MKKILIALAVVAAVGFGIWKLQFPKVEATSDKPTIKIGAILPLKGDYEAVGEIAKETLLMFQDNLKKRNLKNNYEFIIEPTDVIDMKSVVNAARKVILVDNADAVISYWNNPGIIVSEVTKGKDILHINLGSDMTVVKTGNNFNFAPSPVEQTRRSLEYMSKNGVSKLAILSCNNQWCADIKDMYVKQAPNFNVEVTGVESVNIGTKDFSTTIEKLQRTSPELYTLVLETPEYEIARKKMLEKGIKTPVTTVEMNEYTEQLDMFEGSWYVCNPEGDKTFLNRYKEFSGLTITTNAAYIYDIASLMVDAFENANNETNATEVLKKMKTFKGVTGEAKQSDNFFVTRDVVKKVINNERVLIEE